VVALTILLIIALTYVVLILRKLRDLLNQVEAKAAEISDDITELRANVREQAEKVSKIVSVFSVAQISSKIMSFFQGRHKTEKKEKKEDEENDEDSEGEDDTERERENA
jgi:pyruvate/oxaloacetate carboxyltransferase